MKHKKIVSQTEENMSLLKSCKHEGAFAVATFFSAEMNAQYLVLECPDCGESLVLVGSSLENIGS